MSNITQRWRDGWLDDQPLSRYEKLKSTRHKTNPEKNRTVTRRKARAESLNTLKGQRDEQRHP